MHHGIGTNGRQMSMLLGVPLHAAGFELVAIGMPGYGCTVPANGYTWTFDDWVTIASEFIDHELENGARPIVLYGLSAGGGLAYNAAARNKKVKGIIGMTFMDMRERITADAASRDLITSRLGIPLVKLSNMLGLGWLRMPVWMSARMSTLVNNPKALAACQTDGTSAGAWASIKFLADFCYYQPVVEPEEFDVCPVLLTQPGDDRWTPIVVSEVFLRRVTNVTVKMVVLKNAGHYPLEDPGLQQMVEAIAEFLKDVG
ncbi:hypothetical protein ACJ41O_009000 [Fusarium nematophilum]